MSTLADDILASSILQETILHAIACVESANKYRAYHYQDHFDKLV